MPDVHPRPDSQALSESPERVLVWLPEARAAEALCEALAAAGFAHERCVDPMALAWAASGGAGAVVLAAEALDAPAAAALVEALGEQPRWSELPILLLAADAEAARRAGPVERLAAALGAVVLDQPRDLGAFVPHVATALAARRRQYEVRDLIAEVEAGRRALEALNARLEARVAARTREVRELVDALAFAEQRERRRIAQVLHDDLQQTLFGLQLRVRILAMEAGIDERHAAAGRLADVQRLLEKAVDQTRTLSRDLNPPVLRGERLDVALNWLAAQMKALHALEVEVTVEASTGPEPDEAVRMLVFQLVRELLFNVVKHAGVDRARVQMRRSADCCTVEVVDGGAGFDPAAIGTRDSLGLRSVRERLQVVGGTLDIASAPGQGTRVVVTVPR